MVGVLVLMLLALGCGWLAMRFGRGGPGPVGGAGGVDRFYVKMGPERKTVGPLTWDQVRHLREKDALADDTPCAREGDKQWGTIATHRDAQER